VTETMARTRAEHRRKMPGAAIAAAVCIVAAMPLLVHLGDSRRATVTARNETEWDLGLVVRRGDSVMPIAAISAGRTAEVREVLVPGDSWELVWRFRGDEVGTTTVAHDDLTADGYVVEVPDSVSSALRAAGAPPAP
jgi:hypothetical protein